MSQISRIRIWDILSDLRPGEGIGYRNMKTGAKHLVGMTDKKEILVQDGDTSSIESLEDATAIVLSIKPDLSYPLFDY